MVQSAASTSSLNTSTLNTLSRSEMVFKSFALVKEIESPENPGSLEKRVAMIPKDIAQLTALGLAVFVERGAGEGVGFSDDEYLKAGATLQTANEIYQDKDFILKLKGPSIESIYQMKRGCTLFCMAHFHSFPERADLLEKYEINVIAMEEVLESPKVQSDESILARLAMAHALEPYVKNQTQSQLDIGVLGRNEMLAGALRRAGNRNPKSLSLLQANISFAELPHCSENSLYFYDGEQLENQPLLDSLEASECKLVDMRTFIREHGDESLQNYRAEHPAFKFGLRRIQCLHITGQAGARYGVKLLQENKKDLELKDAKAVVLGYGNVARGAMHELHNQGIMKIQVLGRNHTAKDAVAPWLKGADLVVNGAEQPPHLRGVNFLVSNAHLQTQIPEGSVVIDLVGGSASNRSAVEAVIDCTFLTEPHFVKYGVTVSALWGWPMLGMMKESAMRYSEQILDILVRREKLLAGLTEKHPGVLRALVCGPFFAKQSQNE